MDQAGRAALRRFLPQAGRELVHILRVTDPNAPVLGSQWSVSEVASHLASVFEAFAKAAVGSGGHYAHLVPQESDFHARLAAVNDAVLRTRENQQGTRRGVDACAEIMEAIATFLDATAALPADGSLDTPWYGPGVTRTPDTLIALAVSEVLFHGLDVARTTRSPWRIDPGIAAVLVTELFSTMVPLMLTELGRATTVSYRVSWRGALAASPDVLVSFANRTVAVRPAARGERADCRMWAEPVSFLHVMYGRTSIWQAALTGKVLVTGRRPWAATRLPQYVSRP
ncbi:MAG TPA: maleylpyruvate isomerase N-terminal domain-containing protein [Actinocrinis sp.]|uniref:maleylpyruvate isomerase N-terminal domain-containing protein n=1 Tax=Actinocrinis sp. TaxID=1920516 RepID=UPI002DDDB86E|nr:maleylpyruvate isomerase N-terminal domain-containing protein [Actinocrinis sp.]HEV2345326.1 maleylpyruvate isomerase N-terminal domain-containing protein [Actinocrinis sp.]